MCNIDKIKTLIKLKGLKVGSVCEQVGVGRTFLTDVEKGKCGISAERLQKFAKILGTTVEYLCDEEEPEAKEKAPVDETEELRQELLRLARATDDTKKLEAIVALMKAMVDEE